jgi:hypothetical protein
MSGKRTVTLASIAVVGAIWLTGCGNGAATSPATPSLAVSSPGVGAGTVVTVWLPA